MLTIEHQLMMAEAAMAQLKIDFINDITDNINYYNNTDADNKNFYDFYDFEDELNITNKILTLFNTFDKDVQLRLIIDDNNYIKNKIDEIYWSTIEQFKELYK